jgi:hypothetical protein
MYSIKRALLLRWENDERLHLQPQIDDLAHVLEVNYGFEAAARETIPDNFTNQGGPSRRPKLDTEAVNHTDIVYNSVRNHLQGLSAGDLFLFFIMAMVIALVRRISCSKGLSSFNLKQIHQQLTIIILT